MLAQLRRADRGFTIIEILISMMFLSLGIMGVIAFFFLGVNDSNRASNISRATEIARSVRESLVNAIRFPFLPNPAGTPWYRFELPSVSESFDAATNGGTNAETALINGFYFHIDDNAGNIGGRGQRLGPFTDPTPSQRVLDLPREAFNRNGVVYTNLEVWPFRDTFEVYNGTTEINEDDSQYFTFRVLIRRATPRAGEAWSTGWVKPGDVFECTIYVFRGYQPGYIVPFENYDATTGDALFVDGAGNDIPDVQPIVTYRFLLGA